MSDFSNHKTGSTQLEYINLLIRIGDKITTDRYHLLMIIEHGETAKGTFELQFSEGEKVSVLKTLSLGARLAKRPIRLVRGPSREQQELAAFGKKLFDGLMRSQDILACYKRAMKAMWDDRNKGIRLRLVVTDPELQTIPWELLHDGDRFLAVSGLTPLVRFIDLGRTPTSLKIEPPLRLLVASACPPGRTPLGVEEEWRAIKRAEEKSRGLIEVTFLDNVSLGVLNRELRDASARKPYHALHFVGHGGYKDGQSELVFEGRGRTDDYIDDQELMNVLLRHRHLRLVVLNACEGSGGFTLSLLKADIPAVLAMQFPISDEAATRFSEEFYYSLALGSPVDVALGDARVQMYAIEGSVEFATPVLYMQSLDGMLFDRKTLPQPTITSAEQRVEEKRLDKEKKSLGGEKTPRKPDWNMIGALTGVLSVLITALGIIISRPISSPTPLPPTSTYTPSLTLSPTAASPASILTVMPTDTSIATPTGTATVTPAPTDTSTATPTGTVTVTPAPTDTSTATPTGTATPTPIDTPLPTPESAFTIAGVGTGPCSGFGDVFQSSTESLYGCFKYSQMRSGLNWSWGFYLGGEQKFGQSETWTLGKQGQSYRFYRPAAGFAAGDWEFRVCLEDQPCQSKTFQVKRMSPSPSPSPTAMILVPGGTFLMGSSDEDLTQVKNICQRPSLSWPCSDFKEEQPQREVMVGSFWIDQNEVTNCQFEDFVKKTNYQTDAEKKSESKTWRTYYTPSKGNHPVVNVSWNDAAAYCEWQGKRLPTEAEWEKAARGADARLWPWGDSWEMARLNSAESGINGTEAVGIRGGAQSPYGLNDMAGNVWEWTADWWGYYENPHCPPDSNRGWGKVIRGGSWRQQGHETRTASRERADPSGYSDDIGFRCTSSS